MTANRRGGAADRDGVALKQARRRKETTYPELVQPGSRARLVVLALEVGGVGHRKPGTFVQLLAEARTRSEPLLMRRRMEQTRRRWFSILSLEQTPTTEVEFDELIDFYFCRIL